MLAHMATMTSYLLQSVKPQWTSEACWLMEPRADMAATALVLNVSRLQSPAEKWIRLKLAHKAMDGMF